MLSNAINVIEKGRDNEEILCPYQTIVLTDACRKETIEACLTNKQSIAGNVIAIKTLHGPILQSLV